MKIIQKIRSWNGAKLEELTPSEIVFHFRVLFILGFVFGLIVG